MPPMGTDYSIKDEYYENDVINLTSSPNFTFFYSPEKELDNRSGACYKKTPMNHCNSKRHHHRFRRSRHHHPSSRRYFRRRKHRKKLEYSPGSHLLHRPDDRLHSSLERLELVPHLTRTRTTPSTAHSLPGNCSTSQKNNQGSIPCACVKILPTSMENPFCRTRY